MIVVQADRVSKQRRRCVRKDVIAQRLHQRVGTSLPQSISGDSILTKAIATSLRSTSRQSSRTTSTVRFPARCRPDVAQHEETEVLTRWDTDIFVDNVHIELSLWDTAGQEEFDRLRSLSYGRFHFGSGQGTAAD